MEFQLNAGAKLDLFTKEEALEVLTQWFTETKRGIRFTRRSMAGDATAGALALGKLYPASTAYGGENMSPDGSFMWGVQRISVSGLTAAETVSVYLNEPVTDNYVGSISAATGCLILQAGALVLTSTDTLTVTGASLTAGKRYGVNLSVAEVPIQLGYTLLG